MQKQILITGATSMIGKSLLPLLSKRAHQLYVISRHLDVVKNAHIAGFHICDLSSPVLPKAFISSIQKASVDTLVHCAPLWLLPQHITALADAGVQRVIAFSSTSIDGKALSSNSHEQKVVQLLSASEQHIKTTAKSLNIDLTLFRPTMIYGHGQGMNLAFIAKFIQKTSFFPIVTAASGLRRPVHADDLAQAVQLALSAPTTHGKTYVLSGSEVMSYQDMVMKIFHALDKPVRILPLPLPLYKAAIYLVTKFSKLPMTSTMVERMRENLDFSFEQAEQDFGYSPGEFLPNGRVDILPKLSK